MQRRSRAPTDEKDRKADARPKPIKYSSAAPKAECISRLKPEYDIRVVSIAPAKDFFQARSKNPEESPIYIGDRDCDEKQGANEPSESTGTDYFHLIGSKRSSIEMFPGRHDCVMTNC